MDAFELTRPILSIGHRADDPVVVPDPPHRPDIDAARRFVDQLPRLGGRRRLAALTDREPREARASLERAIADVAVANGLAVDLDESAATLASRLRSLRLISPPAADAAVLLLRLLTPPHRAEFGAEAEKLSRPVVAYLERRARSPQARDAGGDFGTRRRPTMWMAQ